jgi:hypothetical protein
MSLKLFCVLNLIVLALLLSGVKIAKSQSPNQRSGQHKRSAEESAPQTEQRQQDSLVPLSALRESQATPSIALHAVNAQEESAAKNTRLNKDGWDKAAVISNYLLFIVACLYSYFGWGLWAEISASTLVASRQLEAIRDQSKIASETLIVQFRPRLIVRSVVVIPLVQGDRAFLFNKNEFLKGQFDVANVGNNIARVTESFCTVHWQKGPLPMIRPYQGRDGNDPISKGTVIKGGEWGTVDFISERPLDIDHAELGTFGFEGLTPRVWHLWIMGWIAYDDRLGFGRRISFCRVYDSAMDRFVAAEDPDYEHED